MRVMLMNFLIFRTTEFVKKLLLIGVLSMGRFARQPPHCDHMLRHILDP